MGTSTDPNVLVGRQAWYILCDFQLCSFLLIKWLHKQLLVTPYILFLAFVLSSVFVSFNDKSLLPSHTWRSLARRTLLSAIRLCKVPCRSIASTIPCEDWKSIYLYWVRELINFSAWSLLTAFQWPSWPSLWYLMVCVNFFFSHTFTLMNKIAREALIINILYKNWRAFRQVKKNAVSLSVLLRFIGFSIYRLVVAMCVSITLLS